MLDCVGVAVGAVGHPAVGMVLDMVDALGGHEQATIWGTTRRSSVAHAALANGYMAHLLDYDDSYVPEVTVLHGNAPVLPAALAIAELVNASGAELALAFGLGFEVAARMALAAGAALYGRFHVTGMAGGFGAAAAAGKLLNLDVQQLTYAFGLANAQAGATGQSTGTMTKAFHAGRGALSGVYAALLAARGFTSAPDALTGTGGFHDAYPSDRNFEALLGDLGGRWELRRAGFKPYACGVVQHAVLDGVLQLRDEHHLTPEDVEAVEGRVNRHVVGVTGKRDLQTDLDGKFSVYHSVAAILLDGAAGPQQYTEARVQDPLAQALRSRVQLQADEAIRKDEAHVRIRTRDQRTLERHIQHASGSAANPMSDAQLERKFHHMVDAVLGTERAAAIVECVSQIESAPGARGLARLLASQTPGAEA
jgi:2-methylcitrate dehydratase PrpD